MANIPFSAVISVSGTSSQLVSSGGLYPVLSIADNPILPGTGSVELPEGNTAARAGAAGSIRFNTQTTEFEGTPDGASWYAFLTGSGTVNSVSGTTNRITATPTTGNVVVDIAATYVGQTSITTLGTITTGTWSATTIATIHGGTGLTSYVLGDLIYASAANVLSKLAGNTTSGIQYLAQTGTGVVSAAPAWTTISGGDITGAALTKTDDTNVTLTLTGTPSTALLRATNVAVGWSGLLSPARGGTGVNNGTSTITIGGNFSMIGAFTFAGTITGNTAVTFPTSGTLATTGGASIPSVVQGDLLYGSAANVLSTLAKDTNATRYLSNTGSSNNPAWAQIVLTNGVTGVLPAANGGSGVSSPTAHGVLVAEGASAFTPIVLGAGQILIGTTASDPVAAAIGSGSGILVGNSSGAITVSNTGVLSNIATANQTTVSGATGNVTIGLASNAILPGTGGVTLPQGNTAARAGGAGTIRFNTQALVFESTSDGATWDTIETSALGVISVSGTANRITASPTTGLVVVDISASYVGQSSITTLGTITTGVWNGSVIGLAYGGTNANLTASNGGIFYSTATAGAILAGTATARQMLQSGASTTPAWSTTTWPATSTANRILYSSSTSVIGEITSANSAVLVTNSSGVPAFSGTMTNGQLIIGSTSGTPTAATLTQGSGITITNGAGTITIAASGSSGAWTKISAATASNSATIAFTGLTSTYMMYMVVVDRALPVTDAVGFELQVSTDGGSTYYSTNEYSYANMVAYSSDGSYNARGAQGVAACLMTGTDSAYNVGNAANRGITGQLFLYNPSATSYGRTTGSFSFTDAGGALKESSHAGSINVAADIDAIRFLFSSGNINTGNFTLYGLAA